jgi:N-acetylglucosaminyldiphosphoundecaprenol N-acetyl-beta-D-mannosaminyltransferase
VPPPGDPTEPPTVVIGDLSLHNTTFAATLQSILAWADDRSGGYVCTPNVDFVAKARSNVPFRRAVNAARLRVPDGMWIVYASRLAGRPLLGTVTGRLLVAPVCEALWRSGDAVGFFGAAPGIASEAMRLVGARASLTPVGIAISPEFGFAIGSTVDAAYVAELKAIDPAVIFVALGAPRQELWMAAHAAEFPRAILVGVGAAFDVLAGRHREAPGWMTRLGFEWLFRLAHEPRRLARRYLVDDPWIFWWALRKRLARRRTP